MYAIALAYVRTRHIKNTHVVGHAFETLYAVLLHLLWILPFFYTFNYTFYYCLY